MSTICLVSGWKLHSSHMEILLENCFVKQWHLKVSQRDFYKVLRYLTTKLMQTLSIFLRSTTMWENASSSTWGSFNIFTRQVNAQSPTSQLVTALLHVVSLRKLKGIPPAAEPSIKCLIVVLLQSGLTEDWRNSTWTVIINICPRVIPDLMQTNLHNRWKMPIINDLIKI